MCDILDVRCIFVNEIVGDVTLSIVLFAILYFIMASKLKLGFDTTISLALPLILMGGLMIAGFTAIFAFATVIGGVMLAWIFQRIIKAF